MKNLIHFVITTTSDSFRPQYQIEMKRQTRITLPINLNKQKKLVTNWAGSVSEIRQSRKTKISVTGMKFPIWRDQKIRTVTEPARLPGSYEETLTFLFSVKMSLKLKWVRVRVAFILLPVHVLEVITAAIVGQSRDEIFVGTNYF